MMAEFLPGLAVPALPSPDCCKSERASSGRNHRSVRDSRVNKWPKGGQERRISGRNTKRGERGFRSTQGLREGYEAGKSW